MASFERNEGGKLIPKGAEISKFEVPALKGKAMPTYQQIKSTFDAGAMPKRNIFALSELVAGQLSVEQEEQKRFAKRVEDEVENRLKIIRAEAHAKAFEEGLTQGKATAYEEEKARIAKQFEELSAVHESIAKAKAALAEQYEEQLSDIAFRIAKVMIHQEISTDPAAIRGTIRAILERIAKEDDVRIRLSSVEFEAIDRIKGEITSLGRSGRISFELDSQLKSGDCIVESLGGEIASFMEEKFVTLRTEIDKARSLSHNVASGEG